MLDSYTVGTLSIYLAAKYFFINWTNGARFNVEEEITKRKMESGLIRLRAEEKISPLQKKNNSKNINIE